MLLDKPIKDENNEIIASSLLSINICSSLSYREGLEWVRENSPSGTSMNWQEYKGTECQREVQCDQDKNKKHYVYVC